uniref:RxLR effector candidate protein n=1 Tax=Hyaloperonospora arabidopsidis (strain Emoy2) TaxID=559515 RepID=M4B436_HYAAE
MQMHFWLFFVHTYCNGASVACTFTVQAAYTENRVSWCLESSRTRVTQTKSSYNYIEIQTCIVTICSLRFSVVARIIG